MIHAVPLEKFDANMEEATVGGWLVAEGDTVGVGQPLVELITDKATFDYESPVAGTVRRLVAAPGAVVPVGYVLALIGAADAPLPEVDRDNRARLEQHRRRQEVVIEAPRVDADAGLRGGRVRATPAARRLARELGIELGEVPAASPGGIVGEEDVRAHAARRGEDGSS